MYLSNIIIKIVESNFLNPNNSYNINITHTNGQYKFQGNLFLLYKTLCMLLNFVSKHYQTQIFKQDFLYAALEKLIQRRRKCERTAVK